MADLATLQVKVDAAGAIRDTQRLGDALKQAAQQGPLVSAAMNKTEAQIRRFQQAEVAAYKEADRMAAALKAQQAQADKLAPTMKKLDTETRAAASGMQTLRTALAAIVGSQVLRETIALADAYKLITARLGLVTSGTEELARVQEKLFQSAQRTRSNYEDVAGLYVRVARNMDALGRTEGELLRFTELVNMQLQIAGATTQEAATGVQQLGQALSKGKLDGDEFRTVLEAMPTVADALTKSLAGGVRAELFKLAEQGKITGSDIVQALLDIEKETRERFAKMPLTVSQAFVTMKNDVLRSIGELDRELNASSKIATTLQGFGIIFRFVAAGYRDLSVNFDSETGKFEKSSQRFGSATRSLLRDLRDMAEGLPVHGDAAASAMAKLFPPKKEGGGEDPTKPIKDYIEQLSKLADLTALSQTETRTLVNADAALSKALENGNLSIQARIDLLEKQARVQEALAKQGERNRMAAPTTAGVTTVGIPAGQFSPGASFAAAQAALGNMKAVDGIGDYYKKVMEQIDRARAVAEQKRNEQIAQNFTENLQRAIGDVFTTFVNQGKLSVSQIFSSIKQLGGSMVGQGISAGLQGLFGDLALSPFKSALAGFGILGVGSLLESIATAPARAQQRRAARDAANLARYNTLNAQQQAQQKQMAQWLAGRQGGRGGVVQSVGTILQETTASRMIGELVSIRVATTRTADAVAGKGGAMGGATVNVTVLGGASESMAADVAAAVDRLLGTRVKALQLNSGAAVTA